MATTTTPTTPKPAASTPAKPEGKHDPAAEGSPPYDPDKAEPYKPAPSQSEGSDPPAKIEPTKPTAGSTSYNTTPG